MFKKVTRLDTGTAAALGQNCIQINIDHVELIFASSLLYKLAQGSCILEKKNFA